MYAFVLELPEAGIIISEASQQNLRELLISEVWLFFSPYEYPNFSQKQVLR